MSTLLFCCCYLYDCKTPRAFVDKQSFINAPHDNNRYHQCQVPVEDAVKTCDTCYDLECDGCIYRTIES